MGVVNATPDSFHDGGKYLDVNSAISRAHSLIAAGADIIDIGGESSKPGAVPVTAKEEIERVIPVIKEVVGFGEILPKGEYILKQDILNKEEEELTAKKGDKVIAFEDEAPVDTVLGADIFAVIHDKTKEKIYVSLEDIKSA